MGLEAFMGDIADPESLKGAMDGADVAVNLAGIIREKGGQTFGKVHVEGTEHLIGEAKRAGVRRFFHQSALGADISSKAAYHRTKAEAERAVVSSGVPFTIFRPSLVVGPGDGFTLQVMDIIKAPSPFIPVPGTGEARFQPMYVDDWVECFMRAVENPGALGRTYELGGPGHLAYNTMVTDIAEAMGIRKPLLHIPMGLASLGVRILEKTPLSPATPEQLMLLNMDNVCDRESVRKNFGFDPAPFREALKLFISPRGRDS
jgi:NADH dehydrogenase